MRLFVAVHVSRDVEAALQRAQDVLRRQGRASFTRPENFHLTLAFIGETDRIGDAISAIQKTEAAPLWMTLGKLGRFGSDLYWAGLKPSAELEALQRQVCCHLSEEGFALEERAFQPHLTLCRRFRSDSKPDLQAVQAALGQPSCIIRRVSLMESFRKDGKIVYQERFGKNLR